MGSVQCADTLDRACSPDGGWDCPPDLDSPDLFVWTQRQITTTSDINTKSAHCGSPSCCPEWVWVAIAWAIEDTDYYVFDATTKKLVALASTWNAGVGSCMAVAANLCMPSSCMKFQRQGAPGDPSVDLDFVSSAAAPCCPTRVSRRMQEGPMPPPMRAPTAEGTVALSPR